MKKRAPPETILPDKVVEAVVKEASANLSDPGYSENLVNDWIRTQGQVTQYLSAKAAKLGGAEAVIQAVFHAGLMGLCFRRHHGRALRAITFADLDEVATLDREAELKKRQPALFDYLKLNVEAAETQKTLMLVALSMDRAAG